MAMQPIASLEEIRYEATLRAYASQKVGEVRTVDSIANRQLRHLKKKDAHFLWYKGK